MTAMPTWDEFMVPVLRILSDGSTKRRRELYDLVADDQKLTEAQRSEVMTSGNLRHKNRIGWATSYLTRVGGLSRPSRGQYSITDLGRTLLQQHPEGLTKKHLSELPGFLEHHGTTDSAETSTLDNELDDNATELDPSEQIEHGIARIHAEVTETLLEKLRGNEPEFFEEAVVKILLAMGYGGAEQRGKRIGGTGDGGVDGVINQDTLGLDQIYVQAKRYADGNNVGREAIQAFIGALQGFGASRGVFITSSTFTSGARQYAAAIPTRVILIDGKRLTELMIKYKIGVQVTQTFEVVRVDEDFFE